MADAQDRWSQETAETQVAWEKQKKSKVSTFVSDLTGTQKLLILGAVALIAYLYFTSVLECPSGSYYLEKTNTCYMCLKGNLHPDTLKCYYALEANETECSEDFAINVPENRCEKLPDTKPPKKNFDIGKVLIICAIIAAVYLFMKKEENLTGEKTDEELLAILDAHIKRKQRTRLGSGYQLNPDLQVFVDTECDIPSITNPGQMNPIRNLKFFIVRTVNPTSKEEKIYHAALDIFTGDMKKWKDIGEETLMGELKNVIYIPDDSLREKIRRDSWEKGIGGAKK